MGISGAMRRDELTKMSIYGIQDENSVLIVTVPDTKTRDTTNDHTNHQDQFQERDQQPVKREAPDKCRFDEEDAVGVMTTGDAAGVPPQEAGGLRHSQDPFSSANVEKQPPQLHDQTYLQGQLTRNATEISRLQPLKRTQNNIHDEVTYPVKSRIPQFFQQNLNQSRAENPTNPSLNVENQKNHPQNQPNTQVNLHPSPNIRNQQRHQKNHLHDQPNAQVSFHLSPNVRKQQGHQKINILAV
jgi:hypothetical protein